MKSKTTAALLALFLGGLGVHKFYLNQPIWGIIYLVFCWTFIPALLAFVECILLLIMSESAFNMKFNKNYMVPAFANQVTNQQAQSIVVNVAAPVTPHAAGAGSVTDVTQQIKQLHDLKVAGALSEEEFVAQKTRLLTGGK